MRGSWRSLVVAAAINVTVGAGLAAAQTMTVTSVPPGMTVELALNAAVIETAKADEAGRATLPINLSAHAGKTDTDVQIFVEICEGVRRVLLVEPGRPTLPVSPCPRKEIAGLYVVRPVTSFVLDFTQPSPWVRLKQGGSFVRQTVTLGGLSDLQAVIASGVAEGAVVARRAAGVN